MLPEHAMSDATEALPAIVDSREAGNLTADLRCWPPIWRSRLRSAFSLRCDVRALPDDDLIQLLADGELHAFEALFDRQSAVAYSLAYRICGQRATAEDVVQDAFLALWHRACGYDRARGSVRSWLLSVVHKRALDARRLRLSDSRNASDAQTQPRPAAPELTETEVQRGDGVRYARQALEELPPRQRQVIELAYFDGLTHRQIAQVLGLPVDAVKGLMRLGLQRLRAVIEPEAR